MGNVGGDTSDLGSEASLASELEMLDEISFGKFDVSFLYPALA